MKRVFAIFLCALWLAGLSPAALAAAGGGEEEKPANVRSIYNAEQFADFARECSRESYSMNVSFRLMNDVDLTGTDYEPAGYFAGCFDGLGHTVSGLLIENDGSRQGLFRHIAPGAEVTNLNVVGSVRPGGTAEHVGGVAGVNEGSVKNCSFSGEVIGVADVGGLVGTNSGTLSACIFDGRVLGEHQVGGIAGSSSGVLLGCINRGDVNASAVTPRGEARFDLASLSQDDFVDISNIGGVAGESVGVVRQCRSSGAVGYKYTGYNVGGIVGKNGGFVCGCGNDGAVEGRRDVGGIVGQSIPYARWELTESRLNDLSKAIGGLSGLLGKAQKDAGDSSEGLDDQLRALNGYTNEALEALRALLEAGADQQQSFIESIRIDPETGEVILPPPGGRIDTTALTTALANMYSQAAAMHAALGEGVSLLAEDVKSISGQMNYVFGLLGSGMSEGGDIVTLSDISLEQAYEHDEGAVEGCVNRGPVRAETNAGGIVGTVGFEVEFDMEDSLGASGFLPSHAERFVFAVIRGCESRASVQSRGNCAGGIVGLLDVGAAVDCVGAGCAASQNGDCVGGIAGSAAGTLARCWSRSELEGGKYIGGAAGRGADIIDCRAWAHIARGAEYLGSVAGWADGTVSGNLYVDGRPDGVDGVSRVGMAEPVDRKAFLSLEGAPQSFENVTVRFLVDGEAVETQTLPFGAAVETLPEVPNRGAAYWVWDEFDRGSIYCDTDITGAYRAPDQTISSGEDVPLFLVEGEFYEGQSLHVLPFAGAPEGESELLGGYTLSVNDYEGELRVRMYSPSPAAIFELREDGEWRELRTEWDGKYLVFTLPNGSSFAAAARNERPDMLVPIAAGSGALLVLAVAVRAALRKRKKNAARTALREDH